MQQLTKLNRKAVPPSMPFIIANRLVEEEECSTTSSYIKTNNDSCFLKELSKIGVSDNMILKHNPAKVPQNAFSPVTSPTGRFPYQRKSRSISPPKDSLAICQRQTTAFFPVGGPIVPDNSLQGDLPDGSGLGDDGDLLALKQQYLNLIQQAPCLNFKSELFEQDEDFSGTDEFNQWECSIMKKMQLH